MDKDQKGSHVYVDMDGTLAVFTPVEEIETLYEQGYFWNLEPHFDVIEGIKDFIRDNPDVEVSILSSYLQDSKYALEEKNTWLDEYLPEIRNRIFVPCGNSKAEYIGNLTVRDVLIDDYTHNLNEWRCAGGEAVKLVNGINDRSQKWEGARLFYHDPCLDKNLREIIDGSTKTDLGLRNSVSEWKAEQMLYDEKSGKMIDAHTIEVADLIDNAIEALKRRG